MSERIERERDGGSRLNGMILISLMLHAVVLILLFVTPSFPSPKLTFGPVYTVSLVNFSGNVLERKSETAEAKELMGAARSETVLKRKRWRKYGSGLLRAPRPRSRQCKPPRRRRPVLHLSPRPGMPI
jgi:hypothetical protein